MKKVNIDKLNDQFSNASAEAVVQFAATRFGNELTLASSLGLEDQVLTHMYSNSTDKTDIFILDTGRLHQETYDVIEKTMTQYAFNYRIFFQIRRRLKKWFACMGQIIFSKCGK